MGSEKLDEAQNKYLDEYIDDNTYNEKRKKGFEVDKSLENSYSEYLHDFWEDFEDSSKKNTHHNY